MRRPFPLAIALTALAASACQTTSDTTLPPLTRLAVHELEAHAELSSTGIVVPSVQLAPDGDHEALHRPVRRFDGEPLDQDRAQRIVVSMELVTLEPDAAARLTGWRHGDERAFTTPVWDAERVVRRAKESEETDILATPRIAVFAGERGSLQALDQRAYIENFEIDYGDGVALADPVVGVFTDGLTLDVRAFPVGEDRVLLDLELFLADVCDPIPEYETHLLSKDAPLTIQQPVAACQRLRTTAECGGDESLVLVAQTLDGSGRLLFAFLTARRAQGGELPPALVAPRMAG